MSFVRGWNRFDAVLMAKQGRRDRCALSTFLPEKVNEKEEKTQIKPAVKPAPLRKSNARMRILPSLERGRCN